MFRYKYTVLRQHSVPRLEAAAIGAVMYAKYHNLRYYLQLMSAVQTARIRVQQSRDRPVWPTAFQEV